MPQFNDDLYLGAAQTGIVNPDSVGNPGGVGVGPMARNFTFDVVPVTSGTTLLATSQNPGSGASFVLTAGAGVTTVVDANGNTRLVLDTPRCITITATGANTATYLVSGFDVYGQPMSFLFGAPSTSTLASTKAFKSIVSVTNANATAGTNGLTLGFNDKLGLPFRVSAVVYIASVKWDVALANDAGTAVAADATDPATTTTTDVRGCYTPSSAANGVRRLVMVISVPAIGSGPNATRVGALGVTQV